MKIVAGTGGTILELLQARHPGASKTTLRAMLRHGRVTLDGRPVVRPDQAVAAGQEIEISPARAPAPEPPCRILYRDVHLLAVEKPPGLLSVARDPVADDTFYRRINDWLRDASAGRERVFIVHRLDREASGIMLFALSQPIQESLQRNWATTEKFYWALVEGRPPEDEGTLRSWLREDRTHRVRSVPRGPGARLAITHYRVRERGRGRTLLEVGLETGRKNQIRVQLADAGCPIVGDRKYGARTDPIHRLGLHACRLAFTHPVTGERIRLRLPLPSAFRLRAAGA
jgi:23S rRNA pseudouridine1911/1915/1917 synthase